MTTSAPFKSNDHLVDAGSTGKGPRRAWRPPATPGTRATRTAAAVVAVVALLVWVGLSRLIFVIPSPQSTVRALIDQWSDSVARQSYYYSLFEVLVSLALAVLIGTAVGSAMGLSRLVGAMLQTSVAAAYGLPKIVLYPIFIAFLGIGAESKIVVGFIFSVFPIMVVVSGATARMPRIYRTLAKSLGLNKLQFGRLVVLPVVLHALVTGIRIGLSRAVLGVILAEFVASEKGIGRLLSRAFDLAQYDQLFATVASLLILTFTVSYLLWHLEKRNDW